jgi:hypothetical protein
MRIIFLIFTLLTAASAYIFPQVTIKTQTEDFIEIQLDFKNLYNFKDSVIEGRTYRIISGEGDLLRFKGEPWLPEYNFSIGIPHDANPAIAASAGEQTRHNNINILPVPEDDPNFFPINIKNADQEIYSSDNLFPGLPAALNETYIMRYARILTVSAAPFQYNPVTRELIFNEKINVKIYYNRNFTSFTYVEDAFTDDYLQSSVINPLDAIKFKGMINTSSPFNEAYWYNPSKNWYKIYVQKKGVYRITFDYLKQAGVDLGSGVNSSNSFCIMREKESRLIS